MGFLLEMPLWCAAGLSLAASGRISALRCIEISDAGERAFWRSAARLPETRIPMEYHVASAGANPAAWLAGIDVAILDPPRKGLDAALLAFLCGSHNGITSKRAHDGTVLTSDPGAVDAFSERQGNSSNITDLAEQEHPRRVYSTSELSHGALVRSSSKRAQRHRKRHQAGKQEQQKAAEGSRFATQHHSLPAKLQQIVYMSCGFTAFVQDCEALTQSNCWQLISVKAFVFFPGTDSLEILAVFKRKDGGSTNVNS